MKCRVSVAMTSYNGEKYIHKQLSSILSNLGNNDEVVISDDGSTDNTRSIVEKFDDPRVKLIIGPQKGLVKNFEYAIRCCSGEYIFLCDQDDVWYNNKIDKVLDVFSKTNSILVEHDAVVVDSQDNIIYPSFFIHRQVHSGVIKNFFRNTYHGCLMAFRSELKEKIFPFPKSGCLHDQWIGIIADYYGHVFFLEEKLMEYKRHENNMSSFERLPISRQLRDRFYLLLQIIKYIIRRK